MAKKEKSVNYSVLLDTSFMIRLLNSNETLHENAKGYLRYFLENDIPMFFSTVSVAEYCVKGDFTDLPFRNIRILPFNIEHARVAGQFAKSIYLIRKKGVINIPDRLIIPNDSKILAQGSYECDIKYFVTADCESKKIIDFLRNQCDAQIEHMDINIPYSQAFGFLDFDEK